MIADKFLLNKILLVEHMTNLSKLVNWLTMEVVKEYHLSESASREIVDDFLLKMIYSEVNRIQIDLLNKKDDS